MDIVVKGRNVEVPDHYRVHVAEKLQKVERYDQKLIRIEVELFHERNPRQSDNCQKVEITCVSRGPVVRAEANGKSFYSALDSAIAKIDTRLRRAADRRRVHRGRHAPVSVSSATAGLPAVALPVGAFQPDSHELGAKRPSSNGHGRTMSALDDAFDDTDAFADGVDNDEPWRIVRKKHHSSEPMTVDEALFQMELVGHDFYLFQDKESGQPSVVYRRKGYHYGLISLES